MRRNKWQAPNGYHSWANMRRRCTDPNHQAWANYGGRGIEVCERWLNDFNAFISDMGPRPSSKHSLDRINNDGNYEPGNVRWATPDMQRNNTRSNIAVSYRGRQMTLGEAVATAGRRVRYAVAWSRITRCGWSVADAVELPKGAAR